LGGEREKDAVIDVCSSPHPRWTCVCRWTLKHDNIAKPFAFLCVAHFFKAFPTPDKIMLQVYVALCRLSQNADPAAKDAVRKGIDIMIPNLARVPNSDGDSTGGLGSTGTQPVAEPAGESAALGPASRPTSSCQGTALKSTGSPIFARYLKRVLSEEGHVSVTLVHLLQVIVRNRDLFFQSR
jgi:hypothetical protein